MTETDDRPRGQCDYCDYDRPCQCDALRARVAELDDRRQRQRNFEERQEDLIKELRATIVRLMPSKGD